MSTPYLLDTSIIVHLARASALGRYVRSTFELDSLPIRPLVSIVTHGEIRLMAEDNKWGAARRETLQKLLSGLVTLDINDEAVLEGYVRLSLVARQQPGGAHNLGDNDLWIAASARAAEAVLLTTDKDFRIFHPDYFTVVYIDPKGFK